MEELLAMIARGLVEAPDAVRVEADEPWKMARLFTIFTSPKTIWAV